MHHRSLLVTILLTIALPLAAVFADTAFFPRRPGISPDGNTLAFSFQGDIWTVPAEGGQAARLTAHTAYDRDPVFSPDGAKIAFASKRYDQYDLFVMPVEGGIPERITFAPTTEIPQDWSRKGDKILFSSRRLFDYPMLNQIQSVNAEGGTPFRFTDFFAEEIAVSPDGESYALAIGDNRFGRTGYRGSLQSDIWIWTPGSDPVQVTDHPGYDTDPMWGADGATIYYRGEDDETGAFNIWRRDPDGIKTRLTDFRDEGVRNARISNDGSRIVFEAGTDIYTLDTGEGAKPHKVVIEVAPDLIENPVKTKTYTGDADEVAVSSDGEEFAMVVHGEIVLVNKELEGRATVPVPDPARDHEIAFRPGTADTLVFVTDRTAKDGVHYERIAMLVSDDPQESNLRLARHHKIIYLTPKSVEASNPRYSPKGDRIAYLRGKGDLHVMDADGKRDKKILEGWSTPEFSWSPDGKWIAYSREDRNYNQDVWIIPADGGEAVNISRHPDDDFGPVWSKNGQMIAWSSRRNSNQFDVYFAYLTREDDEKSREEWEVWEKTRDKKKDDTGKKDSDSEDEEEEEKEKEKEEPEITIDFKDLYLRARRATNLPGDEYVVAVHPKGDKIVFSGELGGKRDLFTVNRFGEDRANLTTGGAAPTNAHPGADGETIYFIKGGKPARVSIDGGEVETTAFRARITTDKPAQRLQIMEEGWRNLDEYFYDPQMHGIDWPHVREKTRNIVMRVYHDEDFADAMNIMLRTLNASHMGYYPPGKRWTSIPGFLGVEFDPGWSGKGLKVLRVVPKGPADKVKTPVLPGDVILAVDDRPVSATENFYAPLTESGGDPVLVKLKRGGEILEYSLIPVNWGTLRQAVYDEMVTENREHTEEISRDRVGYIHIQSMGWQEVERFERDLYAAADDKEALVIDVRNNGGGWTTDMLLTILTQPVHAYTIGRDGEIGYPQPRYPLYRWSKPVAVVCNEGSYSNAEIFSHAIQTIDRGPLVGTTTGGNVISTGGWTTLDGGLIRLPGRGWYVWGDKKHPERNNVNQEHGGAIPDYQVPRTPGDIAAGRDPQLDKAVELMVEAADEHLKDPKPQPKRPAAARKR